MSDARKNTGGPAKAAADKPEQPAEQPAEPTLPDFPETPEDPRDAELAALRAELAAAKAPKDPRDAAIAALKSELQAIKADSPGSADDELRRAFAALTAEVERMKAGAGLVPVPSNTEPDPFLYHARLANGDVIDLQHPNVTGWHVEGLGVVPVESVWRKTEDYLAANPA